VGGVSCPSDGSAGLWLVETIGSRLELRGIQPGRLSALRRKIKLLERASEVVEDPDYLDWLHIQDVNLPGL
jgi:hypothetical protein